VNEPRPASLYVGRVFLRSVFFSEQTVHRLPCTFPNMKPKPDKAGKKLVASIYKEMNMPRLTKSVREEEEAAPAKKS
jgi:hypothetical protein